jgi:uncharacterized protein (DUF1810 family)
MSLGATQGYMSLKLAGRRAAECTLLRTQSGK